VTGISRVARVRARTASLPLPEPIRLATQTVSSRTFTVVELTDTDGVTGQGYTFAGYRGSDLVTAATGLVADIVLGHSIDAPDKLWASLSAATILEGRAGVVMRSISAIDIALWDLRAKRAGLPLHAMLGAHRQDAVPAYLAGGYFTAGGSEALLREIDQQLELGATTVKIKIGAGPPEDDIERVLATRGRIGPDVELIADANGRWSSVSEALRVVRGVAEARLRYLEDPFPAHLTNLNRRLEDLTGVPISGGEYLSHPADLARLVADGAVSVLVVDATACGGVTAFTRVARYAEMAGIPVHTHWFPEIHAPLAATLGGDALVEHFADDSAMNFCNIVQGGPSWSSGDLLLSQTAGVGVALDHDAIDAVATHPWRDWELHA
jgi:L-alanine-DL-glutamate epimerase-like enolase superfamily enzyme